MPLKNTYNLTSVKLIWISQSPYSHNDRGSIQHVKHLSVIYESGEINDRASCPISDYNAAPLTSAQQRILSRSRTVMWVVWIWQELPCALVIYFKACHTLCNDVPLFDVLWIWSCSITNGKDSWGGSQGGDSLLWVAQRGKNSHKHTHTSALSVFLCYFLLWVHINTHTIIVSRSHFLIGFSLLSGPSFWKTRMNFSSRNISFL